MNLRLFVKYGEGTFDYLFYHRWNGKRRRGRIEGRKGNKFLYSPRFLYSYPFQRRSTFWIIVIRRSCSINFSLSLFSFRKYRRIIYDSRFWMIFQILPIIQIWTGKKKYLYLKTPFLSLLQHVRSILNIFRILRLQKLKVSSRCSQWKLLIILTQYFMVSSNNCFVFHIWKNRSTV